jgi:GT2 family glycosyltransferase
VTVIVPTLIGGEPLGCCLRSLESQTLTRFEVIVVDNSGANLVNAAFLKETGSRARVISNPGNAGFGAAVNQGIEASSTPFVATLNDDAEAAPHWLEALIAAAEAHPEAGMFASCVMLGKTGTLDSAGMLLASDGSSKQRGHGENPERFSQSADALFPSGSAALYRRKMLDETGGFDGDFFLYCEDTDLGLRARWVGWKCVYVPEAVVEHRYSASAGRASALKAYYVERNRLYTVIKNFPLGMLLWAPFASLVRYAWHMVALAAGQGKTGEYRAGGHDTLLLPFLVFRAHVVTLLRLPRLLKERHQLIAARKISVAEFLALAARHSISLRRVATL